MIIGLTGGIATGKSTVADIFKNAGAKIVDADKIAHTVVAKGFPAWHDIVKYFGKEILLQSGEIDRKKLGNIIFNSPTEKQVLNDIVHPVVFSLIDSEIKKYKENPIKKLLILDIPLLIESDIYNQIYNQIYDYLIVVYIPFKCQIERLTKRDNITCDLALARINSQIPIDNKKQLADIIIDNSYNLKQTKQRTLEVYNNLVFRKFNTDFFNIFKN